MKTSTQATPRAAAVNVPSRSTTPSEAPGSAQYVAPIVGATWERLLLNRLGTGFSQGALGELRRVGTGDQWLEAQLSPFDISESATANAVDGWFAEQKRSPSDKAQTDRAGSMMRWEYGRDFGNWTLLRRIYSERSLHERMVDFWSHLFHVPINHEQAWLYRFDYDRTIRQNALGSFPEILRACSLHPAMLVYLDNWKSERNRFNENQGRELLELHSVGRSAGYSEAEVKSSAVILSGYTVDWGKSYEAFYDPSKHTMGRVSVLGFERANESADGRQVALDYLQFLALHPSTAERIARKFALYFVSDDPSARLVDLLSRTFSASGGDTRAMIRTLSRDPEFLGSETNKMRSPVFDLVATCKVLEVAAEAPRSDSSFAKRLNYIHGAEQLFSWPRPDGPPILSESWSSASRMLSSMEMHRTLCGGLSPAEAVAYRGPGSWLPTPQVTFASYVDVLCRRWLGKAADDRLRSVARIAINGTAAGGVVNDDTVIGPRHNLAGWLFPRLALALLDTPDHMLT